MDMKGVTREEAVLLLLSLQDQINLTAQFCKSEYELVIQHQKGDSFFIKYDENFDLTKNIVYWFTQFCLHFFIELILTTLSPKEVNYRLTNRKFFMLLIRYITAW